MLFFGLFLAFKKIINFRFLFFYFRSQNNICIELFRSLHVQLCAVCEVVLVHLIEFTEMLCVGLVFSLESQTKAAVLCVNN